MGTSRNLQGCDELGHLVFRSIQHDGKLDKLLSPTRRTPQSAWEGAPDKAKSETGKRVLFEDEQISWVEELDRLTDPDNRMPEGNGWTPQLSNFVKQLFLHLVKDVDMSDSVKLKFLDRNSELQRTIGEEGVLNSWTVLRGKGPSCEKVGAWEEFRSALAEELELLDIPRRLSNEPRDEKARDKMNKARDEISKDIWHVRTAVMKLHAGPQPGQKSERKLSYAPTAARQGTEIQNLTAQIRDALTYLADARQKLEDHVKLLVQLLGRDGEKERRAHLQYAMQNVENELKGLDTIAEEKFRAPKGSFLAYAETQFTRNKLDPVSQVLEEWLEQHLNATLEALLKLTDVIDNSDTAERFVPFTNTLLAPWAPAARVVHPGRAEGHHAEAPKSQMTLTRKPQGADGFFPKLERTQAVHWPSGSAPGAADMQRRDATRRSSSRERSSSRKRSSSPVLP
ncbi:unnamed protein product [Amoebophrya sp. A120]|nr:unnamed protein product [Amoebophrya sp. A120]|eukprot:GSA120T00010589001.1